jgi:hypothetical protein
MARRDSRGQFTADSEDTIRSRYGSFKFYLSIGYTEEIAFGKSFGFPLLDGVDTQHMSIENAIRQNIAQRKGTKI